jgi:hypothetical protein
MRKYFDVILMCDVYADPKEVKRHRDRERYAQHKEEISKRRRQLQELKKQSTVHVSNENKICDTQAIRQSVVTQRQDEGHVFYILLYTEHIYTYELLIL